jgi:predicted methyltransferase
MFKVFSQRVILLLGFVPILVTAGCATTRSAQDFSSTLADKERPDTERALDSTRKPNEVLGF